MSDQRLFHITTSAELDAARAVGEYRPAAFVREGFIHCSYAHQVVATANRIFRGRDGLVLLDIDPSMLAVPVIVENLEGGTVLYPHIYGPLPLSAIQAVHPLPAGDDGSFTLPAGVTSG